VARPRPQRPARWRRRPHSRSRAHRAHGAAEALKSVAAKGHLFGQGGQGEENGVNHQPPPAEGARMSTMAMPPAASMGRTQTSASVQPTASPDRPRRASPAAAAAPARSAGATAGRAPLPCSRSPPAAEKQHQLLDQRRPLLHNPLFVDQPQCFVMSQRPRQEEVDHRGNKFEVGAQPAAAVWNALIGAPGQWSEQRGQRP